MPCSTCTLTLVPLEGFASARLQLQLRADVELPSLVPPAPSATVGAAKGAAEVEAAAFIWHGVNYLVVMFADLTPLDERAPVCLR